MNVNSPEVYIFCNNFTNKVIHIATSPKTDLMCGFQLQLIELSCIAPILLSYGKTVYHFLFIFIIFANKLIFAVHLTLEKRLKILTISFSP